MTTQARELAGLMTNAGDLHFADDIHLLSDGGVLNFGADNDVTLTHVADTGLLLNSSRQLQFGDSGTFIRQEADGVLDLTSDTEIELNATTLDINANVDISGTLTVAGALDFGDLDISNVGSIALDTITNDGTDITLDSSGDITLDADGGDIRFKDGGNTFGYVASNGADELVIGAGTPDKDIIFKGTDGSTAITPMTIDMSEGGKVGIGTTSPSAALHVVSDSTSVDALYLESTEASSSAAPILSFKRHSGSPADADYLGQLKFKGENDADQDVVYAKVTGKAGDVSDGSEDGILEFANIKAGSATITARLKSDKLELVNGTTLEVSVDTDSIAEIGRAHVGGGITGLSDYAIFSHLHSADSGGYALAQNASGATFLNADDGQDIKFLAHGTTKHIMASDGKVGIGNSTPGNSHANANMLVVGSGSAGGMALYNGANDGGYYFARDNANNTDAYDGGMSYNGDRDLSFHTNAGSTRMTIDGTGKVGIGTTSPTGKLEIQNAQVTTQFDRDSFLRLHPSAHTNSGGFTNIFFGTSTTNNYGVALGGVRAGTNDAPEFSIRLLNDSISGVEMLNIDTNGSIKSKSGGMVLQTKEVANNTETSISSGSTAVICSTTITVQEGSKLAVWGHSGQILNNATGQNANMLIQHVTADGNTTTDISDHNGNHYGWDQSHNIDRQFMTSQGISGTLSAQTYTVRLLGGAYNGDVTMNYQSQGSHMIIQEISAN